jgi:hypothetical protein
MASSSPPSSDHPDEATEENTINVDRISSLPTELLTMIVDYLPASFFQGDVGRLTIFKRWYAIAHPLFLPRLEITPRVMGRMANIGTEELKELLVPFRNSVKCAKIVMEGGDPDLVRLRTPANLFYLLRLLVQYTYITALRLVARWDKREWLADPRQQRGYMIIHSLFHLPLMTHLTSLDLDLCGTHVDCPCGRRFHFCELVSVLLSQVQTLRLRAPSICHEALRPLEGHPVTLHKLTVNLYLGNLSDHNPKLNSSRRCADEALSQWDNPMDELRAMMRALVRRMQGPKQAETEHLALSGEMHVWDASTGVCVRNESEELKQFPLWVKAQSQRPCFHWDADN